MSTPPLLVSPLGSKAEERQIKELFAFCFICTCIAKILYNEQIIMCIANKQNKSQGIILRPCRCFHPAPFLEARAYHSIRTTRNTESKRKMKRAVDFPSQASHAFQFKPTHFQVTKSSICRDTRHSPTAKTQALPRFLPEGGLTGKARRVRTQSRVEGPGRRGHRAKGTHWAAPSFPKDPQNRELHRAPESLFL